MKYVDRCVIRIKMTKSNPGRMTGAVDEMVECQSLDLVTPGSNLGVNRRHSNRGGRCTSIRLEFFHPLS